MGLLGLSGDVCIQGSTTTISFAICSQNALTILLVMDQDDDSFALDSEDEALVQQELDDDESITEVSSRLPPAVHRTNVRSFEPDFEKQLLELVEDAGSFDGLDAKGDRQALDKLLNCDPQSYGYRGDPLRKQVRNRLSYLKSLQRDSYFRLLVGYGITPFSLRVTSTSTHTKSKTTRSKKAVAKSPTKPTKSKKSPITSTPKPISKPVITPFSGLSPPRATQLFTTITPTPPNMSGADTSESSKGKQDYIIYCLLSSIIILVLHSV